MSVPAGTVTPSAPALASADRKKPNPAQMRLQEGQYEITVPTVTDRVVQAALKLVLEPVFETGFLPVSYGFRPRRRAQDAIAEIHHFGSKGYRWALDADLAAALDPRSYCSFAHCAC
jgi:RNA-directed DNA polymerase